MSKKANYNLINEKIKVFKKSQQNPKTDKSILIFFNSLCIFQIINNWLFSYKLLNIIEELGICPPVKRPLPRRDSFTFLNSVALLLNRFQKLFDRKSVILRQNRKFLGRDVTICYCSIYFSWILSNVFVVRLIPSVFFLCFPSFFFSIKGLCKWKRRETC